MKILMTVKMVGGTDTWEEDIDSNTTGCLADEVEGQTAEAYAQAVIDFFNGTLKDGETARELVGAYDLNAKNFQSESGDWFWIPPGQYEKDVERYHLAVFEGEEDVMLNFEEGMTGWRTV